MAFREDENELGLAERRALCGSATSMPGCGIQRQVSGQHGIDAGELSLELARQLEEELDCGGEEFGVPANLEQGRLAGDRQQHRLVEEETARGPVWLFCEQHLDDPLMARPQVRWKRRAERSDGRQEPALLRLDLHFHALVLDGIYAKAEDGELVFPRLRPTKTS